MNRLFQTALLLVGSIPALALAHIETVPAAGASRQSPPTVTLPRCVSDATEIAKIQEVIKANSATEFKYKGYREALQSESESELAARLIYSETIAANCPSSNANISPLIANVIGNRIRRRHGDVKSVIFQRDQFASSLNQYTESRFLSFLCPKDAGLWAASLQLAHLELEASNARKLSPETTQYFLYKHSPRWTKEPWKLEQDSSGSDSSSSACIKFFKNSQWK